MSDLTLQLQLHGLQRADDGVEQLQAAVQGLRSAPVGAQPSVEHAVQATACNIDCDALVIDFDFSGHRQVVYNLSDGALLRGRYDGSPVLVFEVSTAAMQHVAQLQQKGACASLPRLLRDVTSLVHPNVVEIKGGFIAQSATPTLAPRLTLVCEPFDQLLSTALSSQWNSGDKLSASTSICRGLSYMQSLSRRFLLEPDRVAVTRSAAPSHITCKLLPSIACPAAIGRWSPPEHADAGWDGLTSPAAVIFSFGLLLTHIWDVDPRRLGPFPLQDSADIRCPPSLQHSARMQLTRSRLQSRAASAAAGAAPRASLHPARRRPAAPSQGLPLP